MPEFDATIAYETIPDFKDYCIGADGSVWSCKGRSWKRLKPSRSRGGYLKVTLHDDDIAKSISVHHLVLIVFVGERPPGKECRHLDCNPANNHISNLAWGTHVENMQDRKRHGYVHQGTPKALSVEQVNEIRKRAIEGESRKSIAEAFPVDYQTIVRIVNGTAWKSSTVPPLAKKIKNKLDRLSVEIIRERLEAGELCESIAPDYDVSTGTIYAIATGRNWKHVGEGTLYVERRNFGERHHTAKLNADMVREARERHANGERPSSIARSMMVSINTVLDIVRRKTWKHVT